MINFILSKYSYKSVIIKGDSAASNHYFSEKDKHLLKNIHKSENPTTAILPHKKI